MPGRGHQFMPVLSFGGGRLHLVFWDQRDDVSQEWGPEIDDAPILATCAGYTGPAQAAPHARPLRGRRHAGQPAAFGESRRCPISARFRNGSKTVEQMQFNAPNLPLFAQGTMPFIGDYLDVTASPTFIPERRRHVAVQHAGLRSGGLLRLVGRQPRCPRARDGNWTHYTAPTFGTAPERRDRASSIPRSW